MKPAAVHIATLTITLDTGKRQSFDAYRVQYNTALGPTKGGIRYHPGVNLEEVTELARLMSLKCSLAGLPFGGAKGGITVDPTTLSKREIETLTRAYVRSFRHVFGSRKDIPAPDMNTSAETMGWFLDEWQTLTGSDDRGVVTGKPIVLGGSLGRDEATGLGGVHILDALCKKSGKRPEELKIAIQGFGNVGSFFALHAQKRGYVIVAISDASGGVYADKGIDIEKLLTEKKREKLSNNKLYQKITNDELLTLDVDVLVPAALAHVITEKNAHLIRAQYIIEMANGPIAYAVDETLSKKGTVVVPDILANAGGVIVSYFEWVQNNTGEYWDLEVVHTKLARYMQEMFTKVSSHASAHSKTLRESAYSFAEERIDAAAQARGVRGE